MLRASICSRRCPLQDEQHWNQTREWGTYFQDDWRVSSNLTLNLGLRWEYYGVPHEKDGRMVDLVGGSLNIFGISGDSFDALFQPGNIPGSLTQFQLIRANSPNPDILPWGKQFKNFAHAIGLSWALPWLGANKTVFRAGYGISYEHNIMALLNQLFGYGAPGPGQTDSITPSTYQSLSTISLPLPIPSIAPLATIPINDTNSGAQGVDVPDHGLKQPKAITLNQEHNVTLRVRADAINLLNTPIWNTPNLNIDSTSFGQITGASGNRTVVLGARVEF